MIFFLHRLRDHQIDIIAPGDHDKKVGGGGKDQGGGLLVEDISADPLDSLMFVEVLEFSLILIDNDDLMALLHQGVGKAGAETSGTEYDNVHRHLFLFSVSV